jgi:aldehyde:ferredoxin oxidoreductase
MPNGYAGKILNVDLSSGKVSTEATMEYAKSFLGGLGINAKIMWDRFPPGADAFSPESYILFGVGPLGGTMVPGANRTNVSTKSPLTNLYACSNVGGPFAPRLKFAGFDNVVIRGRAQKPVYLWIDNDYVELKDAKDVWGENILEAQEKISEEVGDTEIGFLVIGPAGEKTVRFASLASSKENTAATNGTGAVMGSKNLKAVVVRGTKPLEVANPDKFYEMAIAARLGLAERLPGENYHALLAMIIGFEKPDMETWGNFEGTALPPEFENIYKMREEFAKKYWVKDLACFGCPSHCYSVFKVPGVGVLPAMCECWHHWGRVVKVPSLEENFKYVLLCQQFGIDYLSTANVLSFAMDLYDKGIITVKDTDGIEMRFGDAESALRMTEKIASRDGFGDILAEGVARAAAKIGRGAEKYAFHIKGREWTGMDPRSGGEIALGQVTEYKVNTGQNYFAMDDYFKAWGVDIDLKKLAKERLGRTDICEGGYETAPISFRYFEDLGLMCDVVSLCRMVSLWTLSSPVFKAITPEMIASFISTAGFDVDVKGLWVYTEKCRNLLRAFDIREGMRKEDETIHEKMFRAPLPAGIHKGKTVDRKKFGEMLDDYYKLRGWDIKTGAPTRAKLEELNLKDVADYLERHVKLEEKAKKN